jgi:hypothetical protein
MEKKCKPDQILNPQTNRCISKTGAVYKQLIRDKIIQEVKKKTSSSSGPGAKKKTSSSSGPGAKKKTSSSSGPGAKKNSPKKISKDKVNKVCPDGKILNIKTQRCITIGTALYRKALKEGWLKPISPIPILQSKRNCKNSHTFIMLEDIQNIEKSDFLQLKNGYCFSANELIDYIEDSSFNNTNPHDKSLDLFTVEEIQKLNNIEIKHAIITYFIKKEKEYNKTTEILFKHLKILHFIAKTGKICFFNQLANLQNDTSEPFEQSIDALNILVTEIYKLNENDKNIFLKLYHTDPNYNIEKIIDDANKGVSCIHAVGINLILLFNKYFILIEQTHKIEYDNLFTGLYFVNNKKNILFMSNSHWFSPNPLTFYYATHFGKFPINLKSNLIIDIKDIEKKGKSTLYEKECVNESYLATLEANDNWSEIPEWRKIKHDDKSCFDLLFLIKIIITNLNESKNNNPYPQFPSNPFTRKNLLPKDFLHLKRIIYDNYIQIALSLKVFLNNPILWENSPDWNNKCMNEFEKTLRFRRLNTVTDITDINITGFWVDKSVIVSNNEHVIFQYLNNYQISLLPLLKRYPKDIIKEEEYFKIESSKLSSNFINIE